MSKIRFKKNTSGLIKITDTVEPIFIEHTYFSFNEKTFPGDSYQFKQYLNELQIQVIDIEEGDKYYNDLVEYLVEDKEHIKLVQVKVEADKATLLKLAEEAEKKLEADKKALEAELAKKEKLDKKQTKKVRIVDADLFEKSITDNLG